MVTDGHTAGLCGCSKPLILCSIPSPPPPRIPFPICSVFFPPLSSLYPFLFPVLPFLFSFPYLFGFAAISSVYPSPFPLLLLFPPHSLFLLPLLLFPFFFCTTLSTSPIPFPISILSLLFTTAFSVLLISLCQATPFLLSSFSYCWSLGLFSSFLSPIVSLKSGAYRSYMENWTFTYYLNGHGNENDIWFFIRLVLLLPAEHILFAFLRLQTSRPSWVCSVYRYFCQQKWIFSMYGWLLSDPLIHLQLFAYQGLYTVYTVGCHLCLSISVRGLDSMLHPI